ncbi:MAG: hypothetical protein JRG80_05145 [Deltaproteobacteria bacterium]|nr:hypothetical protein [Deltaproteobacteria bacterium]MBW2398643.1 hypothetical protein [Deltaproteobacteria bacterium]MBW2666929.1 hypothetical protein [Deltaproteobacteria bacterium]
MSWHYKIDVPNRLVRTHVDGTLTDADLIDGDSALRNDPEFDPAYFQLLDLREADGSEVTAVGIRALASRPPLFTSSARRALVVQTDLGFGMGRMFELLREGKSGEVRVFRSLEEACDWLDLD